MLLVAAALGAALSAYAILAGGDPPMIVAPVAVGFVAVGVLLVISATQTRADRTGALILASSAATAFVGLASLTAFTAGEVTQPAASLAILAAWAIGLARPGPRVAIAFVAYVAIGVALALRYAASTWQLVATVIFQWPWTLPVPVPLSAQVPVAIALIALPALPLLAWYLWRGRARSASGGGRTEAR